MVLRFHDSLQGSSIFTCMSGKTSTINHPYRSTRRPINTTVTQLDLLTNPFVRALGRKYFYLSGKGRSLSSTFKEEREEREEREGERESDREREREISVGQQQQSNSNITAALAQQQLKSSRGT